MTIADFLDKRFTDIIIGAIVLGGVWAWARYGS